MLLKKLSKLRKEVAELNLLQSADNALVSLIPVHVWTDAQDTFLVFELSNMTVPNRCVEILREAH